MENYDKKTSELNEEQQKWWDEHLPYLELKNPKFNIDDYQQKYSWQMDLPYIGYGDGKTPVPFKAHFHRLTYRFFGNPPQEFLDLIRKSEDTEFKNCCLLSIIKGGVPESAKDFIEEFKPYMKEQDKLKWNHKGYKYMFETIFSNGEAWNIFISDKMNLWILYRQHVNLFIYPRRDLSNQQKPDPNHDLHTDQINM